MSETRNVADPKAERAAAAGYVTCARCGKSKAPTGRSVPMAMMGGICDDSCKGYREEPKPDCRWPGEETCGPGCTKGASDD